MTSKEALLKIEAYLAYEDFQEELQAVVKDLEVLEILKRLDWLLFNNVDRNDFNYYIDFNKSMKLTYEEAVKIKEWLNIKEEWGQYE